MATKIENMANDVVVVTGASAGLGRAIAIAYGKRHAKVALLAREPQRLEAARREVEWHGGTALALALDVADAHAVENAAEQIERTLGPITIWVNNAMTSVFAPFVQMSPAEFKRVTEVTYLGAVNGTFAALHRFWPRNRGTLVQVGSALADRSIPLQSAYCGAKHAIRGFTDSIRCEIAHERKNIRVTMVHMPALNTPQFDWVLSRLPRKAQPVPPIFNPEVGAEALLWAAAHGKREMYVGFSTTKAMWGNKFIRKALDRYLGRSGYDGQMTQEPQPQDAPSNLWQPVPGDFAIHGRFDSQAGSRSLQVRLVRWLSALGILNNPFM